MKIIKTKIDDCYLIEPKVFPDSRGFFFESYNELKFSEKKLKTNFKQDNFSKSKKNVLRGLHFQKKKPQAKLFYVSDGKILDVIVDLRKKSKTYLQHEQFILSAVNKRQIYIPPGFAHGFLVLSKTATCHYKCSNYYDPQDDGSIIWNDKTLAINWKIKKPILSEKDAQGLQLKNII